MALEAAEKLRRFASRMPGGVSRRHYLQAIEDLENQTELLDRIGELEFACKANGAMVDRMQRLAQKRLDCLEIAKAGLRKIAEDPYLSADHNGTHCEEVLESVRKIEALPISLTRFTHKAQIITVNAETEKLSHPVIGRPEVGVMCATDVPRGMQGGKRCACGGFWITRDPSWKPPEEEVGDEGA